MIWVEGSEEQRSVRQPLERPGEQEVIGKFPGGIASSLQAVTPDGRYLVYCQIYTFDVQAPVGTAAQCLIPATPEFQPGSRLLFLLKRPWHNVQNRLRPGSAFLLRWPIPLGGKPEIPSLLAKHGHLLATPDGKGLCSATPPRSILTCRRVSESAAGPPQFGPERNQFVISTSPTSSATAGTISREGKRFFLVSTDGTEVAQTEMISDWSALIEKAP